MIFKRWYDISNVFVFVDFGPWCVCLGVGSTSFRSVMKYRKSVSRITNQQTPLWTNSRFHVVIIVLRPQHSVLPRFPCYNHNNDRHAYFSPLLAVIYFRSRGDSSVLRARPARAQTVRRNTGTSRRSRCAHVAPLVRVASDVFYLFCSTPQYRLKRIKKKNNNKKKRTRFEYKGPCLNPVWNYSSRPGDRCGLRWFGSDYKQQYVKTSPPTPHLSRARAHAMLLFVLRKKKNVS